MDHFKKTLQILKRRKQTIAFAESCTGGLLSASLTEIPGASKVFLGSVVSYADSAKIEILKVSKKLIQKRGAVSEGVAFSMAQGAQKKFGSHWAFGITGIAGPSGGSREKPVGLVFIALVGPQIEVVHRVVFKGSRRQIQKRAVDYATHLLLDELA